MAAAAPAETTVMTTHPSHHRPVLRVLWPRHLCEELRSVDHQALLYGYFIAPAKPSLSPYCTAVVIGAVAAPPSPPARRAQAARALARPNVPPKHDQWRIQLRALGTWHACREDALLAAAEAGDDDHPNDDGDGTSNVLDPPLLLLHAWGGRTYSPAASNFAARVQLPEIAAWRMPRGRRRGVNDCNGGDHHHAPTSPPPPPDLQLFGYTLPREGYGHIFLSSNALGGGVGGSAVASAPWLAPRPAAAAAAAAAGRDKQKQGVAEQPPPQPPATWCFVMGDLVAPWPWLQPVQGASALEMAVACANRAEAASRAVAIALAAECDDVGGEGLEGGAAANADDAPAGLRRRRRHAPTEATAEPAAAPSSSSSSSSPSSCGWWGTDRAALERRLWFRLCSGGGEGCLARRPLEGAVLAPPKAAVAALLPWWWPWRRRRRASDAAAEGAAAVVLPPPPPAEPLPPLAAIAALLSWAATLAVHASSTRRYAARKLRGYQHGDASAAAATVLPSPPRRRRPPFALTAAQRWDAAALNAARLHTERDVTAELAQHAGGLVLGLWLASRAPVVGAALASLCARLCAVAPGGGGGPLVSSAAAASAHGAGPLAAVVAWLASAAPGGVKLHAELALLLGAALRALLSAASGLYGSELGAALLTCTAYAVALASASFGLSAGLAAAADAVGLVAWPVGLAYAALAALYSLQRRAIAVTWGLMRGAGTADVVAAAQAVAARRRRRQRQRQRREREQQRRDAGLGPLPPPPSIDNATPTTSTTTPTPAEAAAVLWARSQGGKDGVSGSGDGNGSNGAAPPANADNPSSAAAAAPAASSDEVAAEHLIVGVLLFTPLIALLPTMAAFYAAAALAHGATALLRLALLGLARQLVVNPLAYAAARRALTPRLFPGDLSVAPLRPVDESKGAAASAATAQQQHDCPPPPPRCYLLGNRPLHYSQLLHCAALLSRFDGVHAFARVLRAFAAGRPFGFVL